MKLFFLLIFLLVGACYLFNLPSESDFSDTRVWQRSDTLREIFPKILSRDRINRDLDEAGNSDVTLGNASVYWTNHSSTVSIPIWANSTAQILDEFVDSFPASVVELPSSKAWNETKNMIANNASSSPLAYRPSSIQDIYTYSVNASGDPLFTDDQYEELQTYISSLNSSVILPKGQTGDCVPLPDDPCVNATVALNDPDLQNATASTAGTQEETYTLSDGSESNEHHHKDNLGLILGTSLGIGIPASTAAILKLWKGSELLRFGEYAGSRWTNSAIGRFADSLSTTSQRLLGFEPPPPPPYSPPPAYSPLEPLSPPPPFTPLDPLAPAPVSPMEPLPPPQLPPVSPMEPLPPPQIPPFPPLGTPPAQMPPPMGTPPAQMPRPMGTPPAQIEPPVEPIPPSPPSEPISPLSPPKPLPPVPPVEPLAPLPPTPPLPPPGPLAPVPPVEPLPPLPPSPPLPPPGPLAPVPPVEPLPPLPPTPQLPPLPGGLPDLPGLPDLTPDHPHNNPNNHDDENDDNRNDEDDQEDPDDECPPKLQKAEAEVRKLQDDLKEKEKELREIHELWQKSQTEMQKDMKDQQKVHDSVTNALIDERVDLEKVLSESYEKNAKLFRNLENAKDDMVIQDQKIEKLTKERADLESVIRGATIKIDKSQASKFILKREIEILKATSKFNHKGIQFRLERKKKALKNADEEIVKVKNDLAKYNAIYLHLNRELGYLQAQHDQQSEWLEETDQRNKELKEDLVDAKMEIKELQKQLNEQGAPKEVLEEQLKLERNLRSNLELHCDTTAGSLHQCNTLLFKLHHENQDLRSHRDPERNDIMLERIGILRAWNEFMSKSLASIQDERASLARQLDHLTAEQEPSLAAGLRQRISELENQLEDRIDQQNLCLAKADAFEKRISDLEQHGFSSHCNEGDLKVMKSALVTAHATNKNLRLSLSRCQHDLAKAQKPPLKPGTIIAPATLLSCQDMLVHYISKLHQCRSRQHRAADLCYEYVTHQESIIDNRQWRVRQLQSVLDRIPFNEEQPRITEKPLKQLKEIYAADEPNAGLDEVVKQLRHCGQGVDAERQDAAQCWNHCQCPVGIRPGADHLKRRLIVA